MFKLPFANDLLAWDKRVVMRVHEQDALTSSFSFFHGSQ
jgi:hypothetical protein